MFSLFAVLPGIPTASEVRGAFRSYDFCRGPFEGRSVRGEERDKERTNFLNGFSLRGLVIRRVDAQVRECVKESVSEWEREREGERMIARRARNSPPCRSPHEKNTHSETRLSSSTRPLFSQFRKDLSTRTGLYTAKLPYSLQTTISAQIPTGRTKTPRFTL